jgi:uncharacterized protein
MKTTHRTALCAFSAIILSVQSNAANADVLLNQDNGSYQVKVMSWWEIPFRSVVRQQYDFSCGSAAVATLLTYHYGRPTNEREPFKDMWAIGDQESIRKAGFSMYDMKNYLTNIGYKAEGYRFTMDQLKRSKRPLIVLLDVNGFKHFVVVKGVNSEYVLTGDPVLGLNQYKIADFEKRWNNIALGIAKTPDSRLGRYNLSGDWGPWSKAPLDDGIRALSDSIGDVTSHLPPVYQLTNERLLNVRVGF